MSPAAGRAEAGAGAAGVPESPATILVVDDTPQNLRLLEAILGPRGHRVLTAPSGPEALQRLAAVRGRPGPTSSCWT